MNHDIRIDRHLIRAAQRPRDGRRHGRHPDQPGRPGLGPAAGRGGKEARAILEKTARRILSYAGDDAELKTIAEELRGERADYAQSMNAKDQKLRYFQSYSISMNRMPDAKARR